VLPFAAGVVAIHLNLPLEDDGEAFSDFANARVAAYATRAARR
jgi:hypothetical protein